MHVFILGARSPVALEWARAFKRGGYRVTVGDCLHLPLSRFSNCVDHFCAYPSPRHQLNQWGEALQHYITQHQVTLVMPTTEEAFYLAFLAPKLRQYTHLWVADFTLMQTLHHKGDFAQLSQSLSIQCPPTEIFTDQAALLKAYQHRTTDVVIKPAYSRFASTTLIKPTMESLTQHSATASLYPWIMQHFIKGVEYCSYSVLSQGQLLAHCAYQPGYRAGKGAGIYLTPHHDPRIADFIKEFGAKTGYTGQVGFDFIEDEAGKLWLLECNPRGTSGLHLFKQQHTALIQRLSAPMDSTTLYADTTQAHAFKFAMMFIALPQHLSSVKAWWQHYHNACNILEDKQDVWPKVLQLLPTFETLYLALTTHRSLWQATTENIEWNGEELT